MKPTFFLAIIFWGLVTSMSNAQVIIGALPFTYTQNFNSYAGTLATIPSGWTTGSSVFNGTNTGPSASAGGNYAFGSGGEFAFGALRSGGTGNFALGVSFRNTSNTTITSLTLSWSYEQWKFANTSGLTLTGTGDLAAHASLTGKSFTGAASGSPGATTNISSFTITGISIAQNETFGLVWTLSDVSGADNGIGIDNFSLSVPAAAVPEPNGAALAALAGVGVVLTRRRRRMA